MKYTIKILDTKEYKAIGIIALMIGVIVLFLSKNFLLGIKVSLTLRCVFFIPGYALAKALFPDYGSAEKGIISLFLGIGLFATLAYILGFLNIKAVNFASGLTVFLLGAILMHLDIRNKHKHQA